MITAIIDRFKVYIIAGAALVIAGLAGAVVIQHYYHAARYISLQKDLAAAQVTIEEQEQQIADCKGRVDACGKAKDAVAAQYKDMEKNKRVLERTLTRLRNTVPIEGGDNAIPEDFIDVVNDMLRDFNAGGVLDNREEGGESGLPSTAIPGPVRGDPAGIHL